MRGRIRKITAVALARKRLVVREPLRPFARYTRLAPRIPNPPMAKFACRITSYESRSVQQQNAPTNLVTLPQGPA